MKRIVLLLLGFSLVACARDPFAELDEIFDRNEEIDKRVRLKTESLRSRFEEASSDSLRWEYAEDLYDEWKHLNLDSCAYYNDVMLRYAGDNSSRELRSKSALVRTLVRQDRSDSAQTLFNSLSLPPDASREDCYTYFYAADRLYSNPKLLSRQETSQRVNRCAEDYLHRDSSVVLAHLLKAKALRLGRQNGDAVAYLLTIPLESITDPYNLSSYYNALSSCYYEMSNLDKAIEYGIKGACVDLETGKNDYFSLYFLARMLFQKGDKERAARYINRAVQDALSYNYPLGLRRSANASTLMNGAILEINHSRKVILITGITVGGLLLVIALLALFSSRQSLGRLRAINRKYEQSQNDLRNVSLIKDRMLGEYMKLSSHYIYKVDDNKFRYRKILKENGEDALLAVFREPNFADTEYPNYWNNFDKIFLSIFPNFVESVNRLMQPGYAFIPESSQSLNTELRILALIRLGITESKRIAAILHISRGTVYTYRCIIRQNALAPDTFEDSIRKIEDN